METKTLGTIKRTRTEMYRQVFVPDKQNNVVTIPSKLYGRKIEVIVLPALLTGMRVSTAAQKLGSSSAANAPCRR